MKKYVAIAPKTGDIAPYLTNGKAYPIIKFRQKTPEKGWLFSILDDEGERISPCELKSGYIGFQDWKIKQKARKLNILPKAAISTAVIGLFGLFIPSPSPTLRTVVVCLLLAAIVALLVIAILKWKE